jgi:hypothetical protein
VWAIFCARPDRCEPTAARECISTARYLAALDRLAKLHYPTLAVILVVVGFCLVQLLLIEVPMLAFEIWPAQTPIVIETAKAWGSRHGRQYGVWGLAIVAACWRSSARSAHCHETAR